jgi:hypothetical protein
MADVIPIKEKPQRPPDNVICLRPLEFRRSDWGTAHFLQMLRSQSAQLEHLRQEVYTGNAKEMKELPPHFVLKGGMAFTIRSLYAHRYDEKCMREVYYLAGLMDCMINQVNPILRTDLLRSVYKKVLSMKEELNTHWYGSLDHVLLPIDSQLFNESEYRSAIRKADTLKALYQSIRAGADEMFDILSLEYVFYSPGAVGS